MRGRKPKHPSDLIAELAARQAAGESPSALAREKRMSRSSVRRCATSVRLPSQVKEQNLEDAARIGTARQREKLFWRFIETYLRQGISLAPKSAPKDVASMLEAAVKLRALMPVGRVAARLPERQKAQETLLIFQRSLPQTGVEATQVVEAAQALQGDLEKTDRAASESASDGGDEPDQAAAGEENSATQRNPHST